MRKIIALLILAIFIGTYGYAGTVTQYKVYAVNDEVTSVNLNGNLSNIITEINGGLNNTNAATTSGFRFYEALGSLPAAGTQGRMVYLTTDNTFNMDNGSAWLKAAVVSSPTANQVVYYTGTSYATQARFTDRGDPAAADFTQANITGDNNWNDLDLSAVVPAGAVAIVISVYFNDGSTNIPIDWRKNGNANAINLQRTYTSSTSGANIGYTITVPCDTSRVIEYRVAEAITSLTGVVVGWY